MKFNSNQTIKTMKKYLLGAFFLISAILLKSKSYSQCLTTYWYGSSAPTYTNGSVGIGMGCPSAALDIMYTQSVWGMSTRPLIKAQNFGNSNADVMQIFDDNGGSGSQSLIFNMKGTGDAMIKRSLRIGNLAASGSYANFALSVDGDMIAKRCVIQIDNWADYVFDNSYSLPTLNELEQFVNANKHLPGVPSEQEVISNGVDIAEMNKILLQKVEELTLYVIEQHKRISKLEAEIHIGNN
jgi:hypothetical protein